MSEKEMKKTPKKRLSIKGSKRGTMLVVTTAIVIAVVIVFNLIVGQLPATVKQIDLSDNRIYTISDTSVQFASGLQDHIRLLMLQDDSTADSRITKFVQNYASLSPNISYEMVDAVSYPSYLEEYDCSSGSLIVENLDTGKYKKVFYKGTQNSLILQTMNGNYEYVDSAFDAEGQITSAIQYVTGENTHTVYTLSGHGESTLDSGVANLINKTNIIINSESLNLLSAGAIPDDCEMIMIYNPVTDLADDELTMLLDYMSTGGKILMVSQMYSLTNFNTLLKTYGYEMQSGYIGDLSSYYPAYSSDYGYRWFVGNVIRSHEVGIGVSDSVTILLSGGMVETEPARDTISTSTFLCTNEGSGVIYTDSVNYQEGDFVLGGVATEGEARLTVFSTAYIVSDSLLSGFPNMGNQQLFVNAVTANFDDSSNITIPSRSLSMSYVSIGDYQVWLVLFVIAIPVVLLGGGLLFWNKRRKR